MDNLNLDVYVKFKLYQNKWSFCKFIAKSSNLNSFRKFISFQKKDKHTNNRFGENVLNKQLWWYVFVICRIEPILMSTLSYQFITFIQ